MNIEVVSEDHTKISQLFFYLQDISLDIQAAHGILQIVDCTLSSKDASFFHEYEGNISLKINGVNHQPIYTMAKIAFENLIIAICRIEEAVKGCSKLLKEKCPDSQKRLISFIKENCSNEVRKYRNEYFAHPFDKKKGFITRANLISLTEKILSINSISELSIKDFILFAEKMHILNNKDPNLSFTWAIKEMSDELIRNGVKLKRN